MYRTECPTCTALHPVHKNVDQEWVISEHREVPEDNPEYEICEGSLTRVAENSILPGPPKMSDQDRIAALQQCLRGVYSEGKFRSLIKRHAVQAGLNPEYLFPEE